MFSSIIVLLIGIAIGVIFHARIRPWAVATWQKFRSWRRNSTRN